MARHPRGARLHTREARKQLPPSKEPYWHELRRGLHIGYYRGSRAGTWWLREYRDGKRPKRRLGIADDEVPGDGVTVFSWPQALVAALGEERPTLKPSGDYTVADALEDYWRFRHAKSPALSVQIDQSKAKAHIGEKLRARPVAALTTGELERWLHGLVPSTEDREKQRRAQATAMRAWRPFRAALEYAHRSRPLEVPSADGWRSVRTFRNIDRPRTRFLSVGEAKRLLNAMAPDMRKLARGALYTGLRLGELLALRVADVAGGQVHVQHTKGGRQRSVPLSSEGRDFFDQITAGRAGDELIFVRADGKPWQRIHASRAMKRACTAGKIAPPATFHDLRRTYGSLLLNAGAEAEIIQELLGHADLRMTRRAYAHLLNKTVAKAVERRLPSFGLKRSNVRKIRR